MTVNEVRASLDRTRERVDAIRIQTDIVRLKHAMRASRMSRQQKLAALTHRYKFLESGLMACQRQSLWGQAGGLQILMDDVEVEIVSLEKGMKL